MFRTVITKDELEEAKNDGVDKIEVVGELADKLKKAQKVSRIGKVGLATLTGILGAAAVTAPVTGGLSFAFAAPAAAMTGVGMAAIIAASALGIALVIAVFKDYEVIEYSRGTLKLRRRQSNA
ncbi:MAG: hypothetical protein PHP23_10530 [Desulfobacterales bacterium]|nr:hypothetical protein [Desulfobacterales bacterium]MDD4072750.1 hypothetical protein [Desulfobacterales bacterium]MDD4392466.1 hypothetical protein [Desulfobacterales bacterium]